MAEGFDTAASDRRAAQLRRGVKRLAFTRAEREFLARMLDHAAAHLAEEAETMREQGVAADLIAQHNADEDAVRGWIERFDPEYVG